MFFSPAIAFSSPREIRSDLVSTGSIFSTSMIANLSRSVASSLPQWRSLSKGILFFGQRIRNRLFVALTSCVRSQTENRKQNIFYKPLQRRNNVFSTSLLVLCRFFLSLDIVFNNRCLISLSLARPLSRSSRVSRNHSKRLVRASKRDLRWISTTVEGLSWEERLARVMKRDWSWTREEFFRCNRRRYLWMDDR